MKWKLPLSLWSKAAMQLFFHLLNQTSHLKGNMELLLRNKEKHGKRIFYIRLLFTKHFLGNSKKAENRFTLRKKGNLFFGLSFYCLLRHPSWNICLLIRVGEKKVII